MFAWMFVHILKYSYVSRLVMRLYIYNYIWMSWKFVDFSCKLDQLQFRKILLWSHIQLDIHSSLLLVCLSSEILYCMAKTTYPRKHFRWIPIITHLLWLAIWKMLIYTLHCTNRFRNRIACYPIRMRKAFEKWF